MLEGDGTIQVNASPEDCYELVLALDKYPEWQSQVRSAEVLERDGEGRPVVVETVSDARVRVIKYRLRYVHEPPHRLGWTYIDRDVKDPKGADVFEPLDGGGTHVRFRLAVDPGRRLGLLLRGPLPDKVRDYVLNTTLKELKAEVERRG